MKAFYLTGRQRFELRETERPTAAAGEALVAVRLVGLCGSDRLYLAGECPHDFAAQPFIPGHEAAGEVVEVGAGVTRVKPGDRVAIEPARPCRHCETCLSGYGNACPDVVFMGCPPYDGALREFVAWPADLLERDATGRMSFADLMMLEPMAIAVNALDVVGFRAGWTAAVVGCGAIGLTVIAGLKAMGATEIIATDTLDYKRDWAVRCGATRFLMAQPGPAGAALIAAEVKRVTGGRGVDAAFECAGELSAQNQAAALVRPVGALALIGINHEERIELDATTIRRHAVTVHFIRRSNETLKRAMALAAGFDWRLGELVTATYPLARAAEAFERFNQRADRAVKTAVAIG